jgi:hypothetical protein
MQKIQEIYFEIKQENYGTQVLVYNDSTLDVILRNNSKEIRTHNSEYTKNVNIKYKITIEKIEDNKI